MASYKVNRRAVAHCRKLIDARQYVLDSDWGEAQPTADEENAFLESHPWTEYAVWYLGLTEGAADETKARHAFVYGDLRRVHRTGLIACQYRAAEWRHKEVELAAHRLLQHLDRVSASEGLTGCGPQLSDRSQPVPASRSARRALTSSSKRALGSGASGVKWRLPFVRSYPSSSASCAARNESVSG